MNILQEISYLEEILNDLGIPQELITPNSFIYGDLQLDSTEIVEVSLALKRKLGIKVKLETRQDKTLAEICTLIRLAISQKTESTK